MKVEGSIWRIGGRGLRVLFENDDEAIASFSCYRMPLLASSSVYLLPMSLLIESPVSLLHRICCL